ncbi:unnamed protein product [Prunus armeniaca]
MVAVKKTRESSVQVKGSSITSVADPKVDKSSPAWDADVSDLLTINLLSSPFVCFKLVDHIHQAGDLETVSTLAAETIRNSSAVASSSAIDLVSRKDAYFRLERKNADVSFSFDKLLARFGAYNKSDEKS